jgi:hypothetical protein
VGLGQLRECGGNHTPVARELEDRAMWEPVEGGWMIHDYHDFQPSKAEVLAEREQKRAAGRAGGQASAQARAAAAAQAQSQAESKPVPVPVPKTKPLGSAPRRERNGKLSDEDLVLRATIKSALVELCLWDTERMTRDTWGRVENAAKQLQDVGAEPDLMRGFASLWSQKYPTAPLTPQAFTNNWADYMAGKLWPEVRARR